MAGPLSRRLPLSAILSQESHPEDSRSNNDRAHHNSNKDDLHHVAIKSGSTSTRLSNLKSRVQALGESSQARDIRTSPNQQSVLSSYNLPRAPFPHKLPEYYITKPGDDLELEQDAPSSYESDEIVLAIPSRPHFDGHHPPSPSTPLPTLDDILSRTSLRKEEAHWSDDGGSEISYVSIPENYKPIPRPIVRSPIITIEDDESGSEDVGPSFGIWEDKVASTKVGAKIDMTSFSNQAKLLSLFLEADGALKSSRKVRRVDQEEEEVGLRDGVMEKVSEGDEVISGEMEEEIMPEEEEEGLPTLASLVSNPLSKASFKKSVKSRAIPPVATSSATTKNPSLAAEPSHRRQFPPSAPDRHIHQDSADDEGPIVATKSKKSRSSTTQTSKVATSTCKPSKAGPKKARKEESMEIVEFDTQDLVEELPKRRRIVSKVEEESEGSGTESELESFGTDEDE